MTFSVNLSLETINGVLCCALDLWVGGCGYWATFDLDRSIEPPNPDPEFVKKYGREGGKLYWYQYALFDGGSVMLLNKEDNRTSYELTKEKIQKGLQIMADKYPNKFGEIGTDLEDADTGDILVQCCLFGEAKYG